MWFYYCDVVDVTVVLALAAVDAAAASVVFVLVVVLIGHCGCDGGCNVVVTAVVPGRMFARGRVRESLEVRSCFPWSRTRRKSLQPVNA